MFITTSQNKPAYHKMITPDRIVNVTGETGSGKSSLCQIEFGDNERYLVIDTDKIFASGPTSPEIESLREVFKNKTKDILTTYDRSPPLQANFVR
jgi:dephospho-CoA kinase